METDYEGVKAMGVVLLIILFIVLVTNCVKNSNFGTGGGSLNWNDTVQGQYCSDPVHAATAQGFADAYGESLDSICTKLWAVDKP